MDFMTNLFSDQYNRTARLFPAVILLAPIFVAVCFLIPSVLEIPASYNFMTGLVAFIFLPVFANYTRKRGQKAQERLVAKWGGLPTELILKGNNTKRVSDDTRKRYINFLTSKLKTNSNLVNVDIGVKSINIASAVDWLRNNTRGKDFDLVAKENATYGFYRNLLGVKVEAITIAFSMIIFSSIYHFDCLKNFGLIIPNHMSDINFYSLLAFELGYIAFFIFFIHDDAARKAGDDYAVALLGGCDTLPNNK